ncbi:MAG: signal peptidase I [Bacillota bacterium]
MKKEIVEWLQSIAIALVIAFVITSFVTPLEVYSISMNPTLVEHDFLVLLKTKNVRKGDIISFGTDMPLSSEELESLGFLQRLKGVRTKNLIKRVIGVEGDHISIKNGNVYVNDQQLVEEYLLEDYTFGDINIDKIPEDKVFVMGDNRNHSMDSRDIGLIDKEQIQGKVVLRVLPLGKIGRVE